MFRISLNSDQALVGSTWDNAKFFINLQTPSLSPDELEPIWMLAVESLYFRYIINEAFYMTSSTLPIQPTWTSLHGGSTLPVIFTGSTSDFYQPVHKNFLGVPVTNIQGLISGIHTFTLLSEDGDAFVPEDEAGTPYTDVPWTMSLLIWRVNPQAKLGRRL
jgi:hypothetical protein